MSQGTLFGGGSVPPLRTLREARQWVMVNRADGVKCPCCDQYAKVYPRNINASMAHGLIAMLRYTQRTGEEWVYIPTVIPDVRRNAQVAKLKFWNLIETMSGEREDGSRRVGYWRVTEAGNEFAKDQLRVPKYAMVYNDELLRFEGKQIGILDALGTKFNYRELMDG